MHRIVVFADDSSRSQINLDSLLTAEDGFCCKVIPCDPSFREHLLTSNAELIIALPVRQDGWGKSLLQWVRDHPLPIPTLCVVTDEYDKDLLRMATQTADDFLYWPLRKDELQLRVARMLEVQGQLESVRDRLREKLGLGELVGEDPAFVQEVEKIPRIAGSDAQVLISGETGTGKELCVRAIHHLSRRGKFPFIAVECGAIPEHLAENEIFGHAHGAFTDAHADQKGWVAMALGGTLFFDEVDLLSLAVQAKLLRLIEEGRYRPLGAEQFSSANIRVIAGTNRDLESSIREKQFRSDLYFRLNVLQLHLPPLRERRGDIGLLARHFLVRFCEAAGKQRMSFSQSVQRMLEQYDWPGNVRELLNVVQRAFLFCPGSQILPNHISLPGSNGAKEVPSGNFRLVKALVIERFERNYIEGLLRKHLFNVTRAAAEAETDRRTFTRLMAKHKIHRAVLRSPGAPQEVDSDIGAE